MTVVVPYLACLTVLVWVFLIEKDSDQRLVKTKLIVEPLNGPLVASATIASQ